jgi:hypothetical protein
MAQLKTVLKALIGNQAADRLLAKSVTGAKAHYAVTRAVAEWASETASALKPLEAGYFRIPGTSTDCYFEKREDGSIASDLVVGGSLSHLGMNEAGYLAVAGAVASTLEGKPTREQLRLEVEPIKKSLGDAIATLVKAKIEAKEDSEHSDSQEVRDNKNPYDTQKDLVAARNADPSIEESRGPIQTEIDLKPLDQKLPDKKRADKSKKSTDKDDDISAMAHAVSKEEIKPGQKKAPEAELNGRTAKLKFGKPQDPSKTDHNGKPVKKEELRKPPVSEAQRRAMHAAAAGKSTIGIPKKVGKEFSNADKGGKLPEHTEKAKIDEHEFNKQGIHPELEQRFKRWMRGTRKRAASAMQPDVHAPASDSRPGQSEMGDYARRAQSFSDHPETAAHQIRQAKVASSNNIYRILRSKKSPTKLAAAELGKADEKGVHQAAYWPNTTGSKTREGVSPAGHMVRESARQARGERFTAQAVKKHKGVLRDLKRMPAPKLPKSELGKAGMVTGAASAIPAVAAAPSASPSNKKLAQPKMKSTMPKPQMKAPKPAQSAMATQKSEKSFLVTDEEIYSPCLTCGEPEFKKSETGPRFAPCACFASETVADDGQPKKFVELVKGQDGKQRVVFAKDSDPESQRMFLLLLKASLLAGKRFK